MRNKNEQWNNDFCYHIIYRINNWLLFSQKGLNMVVNIKINNVPDYVVKEGGFVVARPDGYELWFFGCYDTEKDAQRVCKEINGIYVEVEHDT